MHHRFVVFTLFAWWVFVSLLLAVASHLAYEHESGINLLCDKLKKHNSQNVKPFY